MKIKIKKNKNLEEMSSAAGGQGYAAPSADVEDFNRRQEKEQRLKKENLDEMFSSATNVGGSRSLADSKKTLDGQRERAARQKMQNIREAEQEGTLNLGTKMDPAAVNTEISPLSVARKQTPKKALKAIRDAGFKLIGFLGGGQFGKVFKVESSRDNKNYALKVVMSTPYAVSREVRNYEEVQKARKQSEILAKHFPETFATWEQDGFGFIVMELLQPVKYAEESMVPDRTHLASTENPLDVWDPSLDTDEEGRKQYRDQSKKAAFWFENEFLPSMRGSSITIENHAISGLQNVQALDTDELLMEVSPAALKGLKVQFERGQESFQDESDRHLDFFLQNETNFPNTHRLLRIVAAETAEAPYVPVAFASYNMIGLPKLGLSASLIFLGITTYELSSTLNNLFSKCCAKSAKTCFDKLF